LPDAAAFVPDGFEPPTYLRAGALRLEPLAASHNERDHAAWMSSVDHIRRSPGFGQERSWPREMTLAENRADLERHARDFEARAGFTYTVLGEDDDVVGCVYIYPSRDGVHDALVQSWVRASASDLDAGLRRAVAAWLGSDAWPFTRPLYEPLLV
jgi:hypothetical protein